MRFGTRLGMYLLGAVAVASLMIMAGCGGGSGDDLFLNVSERPAWGTTERIAVTSWGGNEIRYIYRINENGGSLTLLNWSDNDDDYDDEGGYHPAYRPDGEAIAFAGRRGTNVGLFLMDAEDGDRSSSATLITKPATTGADTMPSWKPDASGLVFVTTGYNGTMELATVTAGGTGRAALLALDSTLNCLWPTYNAAGTKIIYERRALSSDESDIWWCDADGNNNAPLLASAFDEGSPSLSPDGTTLLFHSNRSGDKYNIWAMEMANPSNVYPVTQTSRSDGFPVWSPDGSHVAFVRDRELWTMVWTQVEDDRDYKQLTSRFN